MATVKLTPSATRRVSLVPSPTRSIDPEKMRVAFGAEEVDRPAWARPQLRCVSALTLVLAVGKDTRCPEWAPTTDRHRRCELAAGHEGLHYAEAGGSHLHWGFGEAQKAVPP